MYYPILVLAFDSLEFKIEYLLSFDIIEAQIWKDLTRLMMGNNE
jgi:hypothetical protein